MTELHGICVLGIVDMKHHTIIEEADLITITRGYGVEGKLLLPPPYSIWLFFYEADGKRLLDANGYAARVRRED